MAEPAREREPGRRAPLIIYGGIFFIGTITTSSVLIYNCQREGGYEDADWVHPGDPPPASLPPPPGRPVPKPPRE